MVHFKIFAVALLASLVNGEPPVQGYNYRRPQPQNNYIPPPPSYSAPSTAYGPPSNSYLPPAQNLGQGFGHSGANYNTFGQANNYDDGHYNNEHDHSHGHESEVPKAYEFGYSVKDAQSGNDYDRRESSDGNVVKGEYRVALPDGRTQIVTYHADWKTGFHADVRYEGEAKYPEPSNNYQQASGGYNYNAPSDYRGSLTGFQSRPSGAYGAPGYH